jgi:hypothetical protein
MLAVFLGIMLAPAEQATAQLTPTAPAAAGSSVSAPLEPGVAAALVSLKREINLRASELAQKKSQYEALLKATTKPAASKNPTSAAPVAEAWKGAFERYQKQYVREGHYDWETVEKIKPGKPDPCNPQRLFVRADSLDNYLYGITPTSKAKGASISYLNDQVAGAQTIGINGMVSYVALRNLCPETPPGDAPFISGYSIAPYALGQGSITIPRSKKEQSTAKVGVEAEVEVARGFPLRQVFTIAPYYLTDYRGEARAQGVNAYWDVYDSKWHLGGYINTNPYLGWFVQLRGEADVRDVNAVGLTNLDKTRYAWVGGTVRANFFLFPLTTDVDPALRNRLSFIGEFDWFDDLRSGNQIHKYVATAKYNISDEGNSSVQLEYTRGTDKETMVYLNQVLVKLTYAY